MKLFSYIVKHDTGFAPNPFWGYCTLACCKPAIRRTAQKGDWIVGLSPKADGNRIIYAMQVKEILTYEEYYKDRRFAAKIPDYSKPRIHRRGDNIYEYMSKGKFRQLKSRHTKKHKKRDLSGKYVLISKRFRYFGRRSIPLPRKLYELKVSRGHKNKFSDDVISKFLNFIAGKRRGRCANPTEWNKGDKLCSKENRCGSY